jgi:hypothetical protein
MAFCRHARTETIVHIIGYASFQFLNLKLEAEAPFYPWFAPGEQKIEPSR